MKRLAMLCVVALLAIFLVVGCGCGGSQAEQDQAHQGGTAKLDLRSEHHSGVSGNVTFKDISDGVIVKLELHDLPKPNTLYLAHIHPGTCAQGEQEEEEHEEEEGET